MNSHQEHKNPPTFIRRRKVLWRFFVQEIALPHIDLAGQGTLPSPTTGCRIRFPRSLLRPLDNTPGRFLLTQEMSGELRATIM